MANVGTAVTGKTLIAQGNGVSPTFASIGTSSGLTAHSVILGQGNNAFNNSNVATSGQVLLGSTGTDPAFGTLTSSNSSVLFTLGPALLSLQVNPLSVVNVRPGVSNLGIAYTGGTFTVESALGTSLSSSNAAYVVMQSKAHPGRLTTLTVTANQTFTDGSGGSLATARFGLTSGVDWAQDIPFFLYAVMDDTESLVAFMISRNPCATTSPASTSISKSGSIINVNQADFYSLANVTLTSYDNNPCLCLASFRMQYTGSSNYYTVQALSVTDGIGQFNDQTAFTFPDSVNGSSSGKYFQSTGGTQPSFTSNTAIYYISRSGEVFFDFVGNTANVAGVGANTLQLTLPYSATNGQNTAEGWFRANSTGNMYVLLASTNAGSSFIQSMNFDATSASLVNTNVASSDSLCYKSIYRAY